MTELATVKSLDDFLAQPNIEGSPAWEFIMRQAFQKHMPSFFHSQLQLNLVNFINQHTEAFYAIQKLRCIVEDYAPVPDIVVLASERIPQEDGSFQGAPDWLIEIRSPDQSTLNIQIKVAHCLTYGTQLAWLVDFSNNQVWVWQRDRYRSFIRGMTRYRHWVSCRI